MRLARHFPIPDEHTTRPLPARSLGAQSMADQPQRWRRRLAINDWLLEHGDRLVAVVAVVCAAYAVVVTL